MKRMLTGNAYITLGLVCVSFLLPAAAFPWNQATHAYISDALAARTGHDNLQEMWGSVAPDFFNYIFDSAVCPGWVSDQTHGTYAETFLKVWGAAGSEKEDALAYGFLSHNQQWGADYVAHISGLRPGYENDGYIKPEYNCVEQAINGGKGVDVFFHEMIVPAQVWTMKMGHLDYLPPLTNPGVQWMTMVQNSSHSPQGAFGYLLSLIEPRPRLTVATHFPVADDTVVCAMKSVKEHCNVYQGKARPEDGKNPARITWSTDLMVINVSKEKIVELRGEISDYEFSATVNLPKETPVLAKYNKNGKGDPYAQIDITEQIRSCQSGKCNYREDGY